MLVIALELISIAKKDVETAETAWNEIGAHLDQWGRYDETGTLDPILVESIPKVSRMKKRGSNTFIKLAEEVVKEMAADSPIFLCPYRWDRSYGCQAGVSKNKVLLSRPLGKQWNKLLSVFLFLLFLFSLVLLPAAPRSWTFPSVSLDQQWAMLDWED